MSLCQPFGIAIDRGFISSVNDPIVDYLRRDYPHLELARLEKDRAVTIRHLLTMSSGLDCDDHDWNTNGQEDKMYLSYD